MRCMFVGGATHELVVVCAPARSRGWPDVGLKNGGDDKGGGDLGEKERRSVCDVVAEHCGGPLKYCHVDCIPIYQQTKYGVTYVAQYRACSNKRYSPTCQ